MDLYHVWCNLAPGTSDTTFCQQVDAYLGRLGEQGLVAGHRITRRKLGFGPPGLPEFHIMIEVTDLAQLDRAYAAVGARAGPLEALHAAVNQSVTDFQAALYRDFPDPFRQTGEERF